MRNFLLFSTIFLFSSCVEHNMQMEVKHIRQRGQPFSYTAYKPIFSIDKYIDKAFEYVYFTTADNNKLVKASAIYLLPKNSKNKIVVLAHPVTGIGKSCGIEGNLYQWAISNYIQALLKNHYRVILPNYRGLGLSDTSHRFLNANDAAMDVLDAIQASIKLFELDVDIPIVLWGYSQGGQATQRASEIVSFYAPSLNILGSIQNSAPLILSSALEDFIDKKINVFHYMLIPYMLSGIIQTTPELKPLEETIFNNKLQILSTLCSFSAPLSLVAGNFSLDISRISERQLNIIRSYFVAQDAPKYHTNIPLLLIYGENDEVVQKRWRENLMEKFCEKKLFVHYIERKGGHMSHEDINISLPWIEDRFSNIPAKNDCLHH
ncbi:MAG: alpha/beta fold hydrolase [Neisseriaceae bacterium]|nr:MAG: alpha/beta fold hydrolase [Neisseriaceae bacterium]